MEKERALKVLEGAVKVAIPVGIAIAGSVFAFPASTRREIIEAYGGRCADCGREGHLQCHHIVPQALEGSDRFENGVPLCPNDHVFWDNEAFLHARIWPGKPIEQAIPAQVKNYRGFKQAVNKMRSRKVRPVRDW